MHEPVVRYETAAETTHGGCIPQSPPEIRLSATGLQTVLRQTISALQGLGADSSGDIRRLEEMADRLAQGRFHLAVLGQFKRGKSTLLNALLGHAALPTSVIPLTAVPTFVRYAASPAVRIHYQDDRKPQEVPLPRAEDMAGLLAQYVTEGGNPKNRLGVAQVDVFLPSPILRRGVVLIDTPGIGSTFRHNTEAALNFLPQCDAALFLLSADPPITEVEVEFLAHVRAKVTRLFFILNKVDYLSRGERQAALEFLRTILQEQAGIEEAQIFCLSAKMGLEAREGMNPLLWRESGLEEIEDHLVEFLADEKATDLRRAIARRTCGILEAALMQVRLSIRSMQMPAEELQQRLETLERKIGEVQRERFVANDLLAGDRRRMHDLLEEHSEALRHRAAAYLGLTIRETAAAEDGRQEPSATDRLAAVIPGFFEHHAGAMTSLFASRVAEALRPHQRRADSLIESVRVAAAELFDVSYRAPESESAFEMAREPCWITHKWMTEVTLIPPGALDRFLPPGIRKRWVMKRLREQVSGLVVTNVENLRWAIYQSLDQTFLRFGSSLDDRLHATIQATRGAIQAALTKRREHSEAVAGELADLAAAEMEISRIKTALEREALT